MNCIQKMLIKSVILALVKKTTPLHEGVLIPKKMSCVAYKSVKTIEYYWRISWVKLSLMDIVPLLPKFPQIFISFILNLMYWEN